MRLPRLVPLGAPSISDPIFRAMCGRVRLSFDVSEIKLAFSIPPHRPTPNFAPSWNAAPTDQLPIVRFDKRAGERSLDPARWGLVPYWAKDIKVGFANINAKAEGIENRPAFQRRRCLVPVDNFYEWKKTRAGKHPYAIALVELANGCSASRLSQQRRMSYAPSFTTGCRSSSALRRGRSGSGRRPPRLVSSSPCLRRTRRNR